MTLSYIIKKDNKYRTIKEVLKNEFNISQRLILKLKINNRIFLNKIPAYVTKELTENDLIEINIDFQEKSDNVVPTKMDLNIIYEDESYLIINKPPKIAVHPSNLHYSTSLANGVQYYYDSKDLNRKIHLVNRLDKDTSGIVIFAKNEYIQECLTRQMQTNEFYKEYVAVVEGKLENKFDTIDAPIGRKEGSIIERCVDKNGERAVTHYEVLRYLDSGDTVVKFILETGRTHQIRVHSAYINHPIIGDTLYGKESDLINRQALHSNKVSFIHPITKQEVTYIAEMPDDISSLIK